MDDRREVRGGGLGERKRRLIGGDRGRRAVAILAAAAGLLLLAGFLFALGRGGAGSGTGTVLVSGALLLSAVLILVSLFLFARDLVKVFLDRRHGVPGARYRSKVVALVVGLTLVPTLLLFFAASGVLRAAFEQAFEPDREAIFRDGRTLVHRYESEEEQRGARAAFLLASDASVAGLVETRGRRALSTLLERRRNEDDLAGLRVYDARGRIVAQSYDPVHAASLKEVVFPERAIGELVAEAREPIRNTIEAAGELVVMVGVPIRAGSTVRGAAVAIISIDPELTQVLARLTRHFDVYEQAKGDRERVQRGMLLVLTFFTLLLLVGAVWIGSTLAKTMTVPIQRLAEATQAVSEGRFDFRVDVDAPDELGVLVRSFNRMLEELRMGRVNVERSTLDLQRTNVELDGRRHYIETLLENIPTGVVSLDPEGRLSNINHAAIQMFGFKERPPAGLHFRELFGAKEFLELRILVEKVIGIRDLRLVRELHLRFERRTADLALSFTALRGPQDEDLGLTLVLEDLSNLIKAQKVAAWREVARRIAHEIKNPLTPIQLSAQRILKKWREGDPAVGAVIEECAETITQEVDGLKTLVNEFSRFARMPPVAPVPAQLERLIHNALMLYEGLHPELSIERQVAADIPTVMLDPEQMKRVLINLVDNAIECQNGVGRVRVSGRYDPRTQSARIEVADEGPGIAPEDRDKLFVPYFSTKRSGTGLGLAIVHRIVSDHGGTIRVEDSLPHGARFVIELPA